MRKTSTQLLRIVPVAIVLAVVLGGSTPARADVTCNQDLRACYFRAALADTWWQMWAIGADCELGYVDCTRRAIIGR